MATAYPKILPYPNLNGGGSGGGATAVAVTSTNNTITQIGASSYNPLTHTISIDLEAIASEFYLAGTLNVASNGINNKQPYIPSLTTQDAITYANANTISPCNLDVGVGAFDTPTSSLDGFYLNGINSNDTILNCTANPITLGGTSPSQFANFTINGTAVSPTCVIITGSTVNYIFTGNVFNGNGTSPDIVINNLGSGTVSFYDCTFKNGVSFTGTGIETTSGVVNFYRCTNLTLSLTANNTVNAYDTQIKISSKTTGVLNLYNPRVFADNSHVWLTDTSNLVANVIGLTIIGGTSMYNGKYAIANVVNNSYILISNFDTDYTNSQFGALFASSPYANAWIMQDTNSFRTVTTTSGYYTVDLSDNVIYINATIGDVPTLELPGIASVTLPFIATPQVRIWRFCRIDKNSQFAVEIATNGIDKFNGITGQSSDLISLKINSSISIMTNFTNNTYFTL